MRHFTPTYKFSSEDILVNSYSGMSDHDQIIRSFQQGNIANNNILEKLIKNSEEQFKAKLKNDRALAGNQLNVLNNILNSNSELKATLNEGFGELYLSLSNVTSQLEIQHAAMLEQYNFSNKKLETIIEYLKLPEFERERLFFIQKAMEFLKQSFVSSKRYKDALNFFLKSDNGTDFFVLKQIGLIYLYGEDEIDFKKATEYLEKAYCYANSAQEHMEMASIAKHIAYSYLLRGQLKKCIEWSDISLNLNYDLGLQFIKAEALMMIGEPVQGIKILEEISAKDIGYFKEAVLKDSFQGEELEKLKKIIKKNIHHEINNITWEIEKLINDDSPYHDTFVKLNNKISKTFIPISTLIEVKDEMKKLLAKIKDNIESINRIKKRIKKNIIDNFDDLTGEQYLELMHLIDEDYRLAEAKFGHYLTENIELKQKELYKSKRIIIHNPSAFISKVSIFGLGLTILLFYLNILGIISFWFSFGALITTFIIVKIISMRFDVGYTLVILLTWSIPLLPIIKFFIG